MSLRQLQVASLRKLARQVASSATTMRRKTQSIRATVDPVDRCMTLFAATLGCMVQKNVLWKRRRSGGRAGGGR